MSDSHLPPTSVARNGSSESCDTLLPLLSLVADNEASAEEAAQARAHLLLCSSCASHLAFLRASQMTMRGLPDIYPTPAVRQRIARQTFARLTFADRVAGWLRPTPVRAGVGLAATAVVCMAVFLRMPQSGRMTEPLPIVATNSPVAKQRAVPSPDADAKQPTTTVERRIANRATIVTGNAKPTGKTIIVKRQPVANAAKATTPRDEKTFVAQNDSRPANNGATVAREIVPPVDVPAPASQPKRQPSNVIANAERVLVLPQPTAPRRDRVAVVNPTRVAPTIPKTISTPTPATVAKVGTENVYDNDERPDAAPRVLVAVNDPDGGDYSPESGRLRISTRRPNFSGTISLASDDRGSNGARASNTAPLRLTENSPFSDGPSLKSPIVTSPVSTN